jgi:antitoxin PrlF
MTEVRRDAMESVAKVTSKGQITLPKIVREELGITTGDNVRFISDRKGMRVIPVRKGSRFEEFRGIGNPGLPSGKEAIVRYFRELRGHDDLD